MLTSKAVKNSFKADECLQQAEARNREAHDRLMNELGKLRSQLDGSDRRQSLRRKTDAIL